MKKRYLGAALAALLFLMGVGYAPPASAATAWTTQDSGVDTDLNDVEFDSTTRGVAVGDDGVVLRTTDGGDTWTKLTSGTTVDLFAAELVAGECGTEASPADCIWVGGANGTIRFSADSGATWCAQTTGSTATINRLTAVSVSDLIAVGSGGTLLRSTEQNTGRGCGAEGSYEALTSGVTVDLNDAAVDTSDSVDALVVGDDGTVLSLTLADNTVAKRTSGTTEDLFGVDFGMGDAGDTWFVSGAAGTLLTSADGTTFEEQDTGTNDNLFDVTALSDTDAIAVGDFGTVVTTDDGGDTWAAETSGTCSALFAVSTGPGAADAFETFAVGAGGTIIVNEASASATQPNCVPERRGTTGYRMVAADGGVFVFGDRGFFGSTGDRVLNKPIVGGATNLGSLEGYWLVASDGGIFAFGDAPFYGSMAEPGKVLDSAAVDIEPTPTGKGYWIVSAKGTVYPFGDAKHHGDTKLMNLNQPIIAMSITPSGEGYWLVGQDGGIFTFGDADFFGSMGGTKLNAPVIDLGPTPDGQGYYLAAKDGGIFTFGTAEFRGSTGDMKLNQPVIAMLVAPNGAGYWMAAGDGGIFTFGPGIPFHGSTGDIKLNSPVLDIVN